jgi:regulator of sigma E protease
MFIVGFHELGHFLAAKTVGIHVQDFSIGIGPKLFGFHFKGTNYNVRLLPFGGFVKFGDEESYRNSPSFKRFCVLISGPLFNFLFSFLLLFIFALTKGVAFLTSLQFAFYVTEKFVFMSLDGIKKLFTGLMPVKQLSGPVGMVDATTHLAQNNFVDHATNAVHYSSNGILMFVLWAGLISVSIGIFNLIPIPAFDGGRIVMLLLQKIKFLNFNKKKEDLVLAISGLFLIAFVIFTFYNDIARIITRLF